MNTKTYKDVWKYIHSFENLIDTIEYIYNDLSTTKTRRRLTDKENAEYNLLIHLRKNYTDLL